MSRKPSPRRHGSIRAPPDRTGGVYAISADHVGATPPYKIGSAFDYRHRLLNYFTSFPRGFQSLCFLRIGNMKQLMQRFRLGTASRKPRNKQSDYEVIKSRTDVPFMQRLTHALEASIHRAIPTTGRIECKSFNNHNRLECEWFDIDYRTLVRLFLLTLQEYNNCVVIRKQGAVELGAVLALDVRVFGFSGIPELRKFVQSLAGLQASDFTYTTLDHGAFRIRTSSISKLTLRDAPRQKRQVADPSTGALVTVPMQHDVSFLTPTKATWRKKKIVPDPNFKAFKPTPHTRRNTFASPDTSRSGSRSSISR